MGISYSCPVSRLFCTSRQLEKKNIKWIYNVSILATTIIFLHRVQNIDFGKLPQVWKRDVTNPGQFSAEQTNFDDLVALFGGTSSFSIAQLFVPYSCVFKIFLKNIFTGT